MSGLAIDTYGQVATLGDGPMLLNLSWTLDEREWLSVDLKALVGARLHDEVAAGLHWTQQYLVKDPYGCETLGGAVERCFGVAGIAGQISSGAGVNALLHGLASLPQRGVAMADGGYPDYPHWLYRRDIPVYALDSAAFADGQASSTSADAAVDLFYVERPALFPAAWDSLDGLRRLCAAAADTGAIVLVDESNANYCAPAFSALALTAECDNLIVLRGLSKAYGMGGLRLGYCVSSMALTARVRHSLPALGASSLSLMLGREILDCGDIGAPLRARIAEAKQTAHALLDAAGLAHARLPVADALPYLMFDAVPELLADTHAGVLAGRLPRVALKRHPLWSADGGRALIRCSVPLRAERMALFAQRFADR